MRHATTTQRIPRLERTRRRTTHVPAERNGRRMRSDAFRRPKRGPSIETKLIIGACLVVLLLVLMALAR